MAPFKTHFKLLRRKGKSLASRATPQSTSSSSTPSASPLPDTAPLPNNTPPPATAPQNEGLQPASKCLWIQAYEDLRSKEPILIEDFEKILAKRLPLESVDIRGLNKELVTRVLDEKLKDMNDKRWVLKISDQNLDLRKSIIRAIKIIEITAMQFVAPAANIAPVHIGFPLAGACIVLSVS
jgi:hypothetical protein